MTSRLRVGSKAPAFTLRDRDGNRVPSRSLRGKRVFLYFYPKADTPGCTRQACGLRDVIDEVGDTVVVGISPDPPERLARFAEKYDLPFLLLSDPDHQVAEKYGVWGEKKMYGRTYQGIVRSAFLIGPDGTLERIWSPISPADTPKKLLAALSGSE